MYFGAAATIFFYTGSAIVQLVFSTPGPGVSWQEQATGSMEYESGRLSVPSAAVGIAIDLFILILPIRAVLDLQLSFKRKIEVGLVFATGILAVMSSILSCVYRVQFNNTDDSTWAVTLIELT
ncbi:hypothetical protein MMC11_005729, partial [Xylographa trunciseda]|nr:hypothetical protein [Xylographa trunciseda]